MPFMSSIIQDMRTLFSSPIFPKSGSEMMFSVRELLHNMRNAHGDNRFDIYDWIPLFAVLFATALILNGIFPNSLALSAQGLSFGRQNRAQDLEEEEEESVLDNAMAQLENGVLLMSAIRAGGDCSARLACRLGQMTRQNSDSADMILDAVEFLAPTISGSSRYTNFTSSFSAAVRAEDLSACSAQCSRCLVI